MKQLMELTGVSRQVIHFYVKKGLVPPPIRHSRTSAEYTDEHVERILAVRRMREDGFLPLDAIRAALDERDEAYNPPQRLLIAAVRSRFGERKRAPGQQATLALTTAARRCGVPAADIRALAEAELIDLTEDVRGRPRVARDDLWLIEAWAELGKLGFGTDDGFTPADLAIYQRAIEALVREEVTLLTARLADRPPDRIADQIRRVLPLMATVLGQLHDRAVRRFLDTQTGGDDE
jgi:DNA-binding transcriptional MerR regulator